MGVDIIDVEGGNMRIRASTDNGDAEAMGVEVSPTGVYVAQDEVHVLEPHVGMEFESESAAKTFYDDYARRTGFSTKICQTGRFRPDSAVTSRQFVCTKEGLKRRPSECEAMLKIELKGNKWAVTKFVKEHNHALESPSKLHSIRPHKHFAGAVKNVAEVYQAGVMVPSGVMYVTMDGNHVSQTSVEANRLARSISPLESSRLVKTSNCINHAIKPATPKRTWGKDAQNMLDYFKKMQAENPGFFYAIQLDEDNRMANAFWADARSRTAYSHFGDVVTLDTSYKVNQYKVPFAPFTGVNHHGQTILFGCALLLDDSEASFVWLLRTFVTAMSDRPPVSIVTDQDRAIQAAVSQVLPKSRHRINKSHILREGQEKLAHVCHMHPNFQAELYNCVNLTETIEEFESSWDFIIDKYDLRRNDWLQSLYNARRQWVPVYFRDTFFAAVSPNQGVECSFFDGYVNQHTTLPMFFRQYERAMEYWFEKEIEADFDTISNTPVLSTPSPMEKQAADLYTRKIFTKFQDELVETFVYTANRIDGDGDTSTYRVAKFEDDHKAYTVTLNISDMRASCSCLMFEYSGILCRHILTVFTVTNVLTLPPHYILRRWTRNAKSVVSLDEPGANYAQESTPSRYNSLCREAVKYAEEGATASDTYTAALTGLKEGAKKIAAVKKIVAKVVPQTPKKSTSGYVDKNISAADSPLLWPRQDEVTRQFNLNDSATLPHYVSGMNLLRVAPTSVQRDDGPTDNMVVLPCLKSMTWVMESKNSTPANRVAVINLKLQDYSKSPAVESEVKFQLSTVTLEPMLKSMAQISEQLSTPANRVAVINLKLQDTETISGESEVKFQVSRDTLGAMLRSMAYIREQLSVLVEAQIEQPSKKQRK
ncbi:protein FAR1-RELATED SEQUENCE 3-like isoform X1 [Chenopodium quinoa]|uniref:protein FAR1-RELATED SEQUENCE 3-like isoform X1 n=2 Tax=Chenopodium quinoa TaxID=63459 RepID=UPI000B7714C5|nr:protein FAR1-RELATED SEQUENCE 3-like isoform X1 [Chenopodium quinoa]